MPPPAPEAAAFRAASASAANAFSSSSISSESRCVRPVTSQSSVIRNAVAYSRTPLTSAKGLDNEWGGGGGGSRCCWRVQRFTDP